MYAIDNTLSLRSKNNILIY